jgi:hypothetical protein
VSGQTGILVPNGKKVILTCNGTDIVEAHTAIVGNATMGGTLGVTGATTLSSALTYGGVTLSNSVTGTGSMVLSASPTLTGTLNASGGYFTSNVGIGVSPAAVGAYRTLAVDGTTGGLLNLRYNGADNGYVYGSVSGLTVEGVSTAPVIVKSSGATIGTFSSTGLAVTGALSVTGTSTLTGNVSVGAALNNSAAWASFLQASGAGNAALSVRRTSATAQQWDIAVQADGHLEIYDNTRAAATFNITNTGAVTIPGTLGVTGVLSATGNVFSGTSGSTQRNITLNTTGGAVVIVSHSTTDVNGDLYAQFNYNGTQIGSITQSGTTAVAYNTSSDYRLKENVQPMTDALATVTALKPVTFNWKSDGSDGQGFIAHELQAVVPDCVTGEKDATEMQTYEISPAIPATKDEEGNELTAAIEAVMGEREVPRYQGIDTSFLVATLTAAIQELKAIVDAQATRIAALEAK